MIREDAKRKRSKVRRKFRTEIVDYLGGCCALCRYDKCLEALEVHHYDETTKDFNLSERVAWSIDVVTELKKCCLLCVRCHREVHAGFHPQFLDLGERYL